MFGNPVAGVIRPFGSVAAGTFRVTAPFGAIDASHPTPHGGVDIGNGKCGEPLLAMASGRITMAQYLDSPLGPKTALTVRGIDPAHPDYEWAIAHCASLSVKVGALVTIGQHVGVLGKTGTMACHAHLGLKVKVNGVWVSQDIWPLLDQNQPAGGDMLQGTNPVATPNRRTAALGANTRLRAAPATGTTPILAEYPIGTLFTPDFYVQGGAVTSALTGAITTGWYAGWSTTPKGIEFGYMHESVLAPLAPIEQTGHSDQELADAAKAAAHKAATDVAAAGVTATAKYPA